MSLTRVDTGLQSFPDFARNQQLAGAQIYIGVPGLDPQVLANQYQAYIVQENGTQVEVSQPVLTSPGGVPTYNGSPVQIAVSESAYSLKVLNSQGAQIYYQPDNTVLSIVNASQVAYTPLGAGLITTTVEEKLHRYRDVLDGCTGSGFNESPGLQAVIDAAPPYSEITIPSGITLGLSAQVVINKPLTLISHGVIELLGSTTLGTPIIKVTSDDVTLDFRGPIHGNNTNWSGILVSRDDRCLRNVNVNVEWIDNLNPNEVSVSQFALAYLSVIGGRIGFRGEELGGYGVYTQFCQDVHGEDIQAERVNYSAVNASANLSCSFKKVRARKIGYFGYKGGYGLAGTISNHLSPTSTTFSIAKTNANVLAWKEGQEFVVVINTTTCIFPKVASLEDFSTYLKITTAEAMAVTPTIGQELQILDGTVWDDVETWWTGDTSPDMNGVGRGFKLINCKSRYTGRYTGYGSRLALGCPWIGYDPQGSNNGFRIKNIEVINFDSDESAGPGLQILCVEKNVKVTGKATNFARLITRKNGTFVPNDPTPEIAGIEVNTLTFAPCRNIDIDFNSVSSNGASHYLNYCLYGTIKGYGDCAAGVILQDTVGGVDLDGMNVISGIAGAAALEVKFGAQPSTDIRLLGGRFTANGAGSKALYVSASNASQIMISGTTKLDAPAGTAVVSNSTNAFSAPEYASLPLNQPLIVPIGQAISAGVNCIVGPSLTQEICRIIADNGTNGLIEVSGAVWNQGTGAKETFTVKLQGDTGTIVSSSPAFTSGGSSNGTAFLVGTNFTAATAAGGVVILRYTCPAGNTHRFDMIVRGISRT